MSKQENALSKSVRYLKEQGIAEFTAHAAEKVRDSRFHYQTWIRKRQISSVQAGYQKKLRLPFMPKIYVLIAKTQRSGSDAGRQEAGTGTLRSIKESTYPLVYPVQALNSQIRDEDFVTFVREGDLIERDAFFEMARLLQDGADAVYTDEDSWRERDGRIEYSQPRFKPDYNPDYLRSVNYIGHLFLVRVGIIRSFYRMTEQAAPRKKENDRIPSVKNLADDAYYYSLVLRCTRRAASGGGVNHVPKILCHTLISEPLSAADPKRGRSSEVLRVFQKPSPRRNSPETELSGAMREVLLEDLKERGRKGTVENGPLPDTFHVAYEIEGEPLVSIIIPNRDCASVLENCILSIRLKTTWKRYEIIVVENNSKQKQTFELYKRLEKNGEARIVRYADAFHFSRVINEGAGRAQGDYLILMNNDVTVRTPDWIERLLSQVSRPEIGAAGPKLLYPDGRVQSAGIVIGIMGFAGSMMVAEDGDDPGYMGRASLTQDMSAVTAACMMVKRTAFEEAGGMPDEYAVALGDVDFCLSLGKLGYRIVFEPAAVMIHHESLTRGAEDTKEKKKRFAKEKAVFRRKWARLLKEGDPAYNPNLSRRRCDWSQQT